MLLTSLLYSILTLYNVDDTTTAPIQPSLFSPNERSLDPVDSAAHDSKQINHLFVDII